MAPINQCLIRKEDYCLNKEVLNVLNASLDEKNGKNKVFYKSNSNIGDSSFNEISWILEGRRNMSNFSNSLDLEEKDVFNKRILLLNLFKKKIF